jgi:hypothetical protein
VSVKEKDVIAAAGAYYHERAEKVFLAGIRINRRETGQIRIFSCCCLRRGMIRFLADLQCARGAKSPDACAISSGA